MLATGLYIKLTEGLAAFPPEGVSTPPPVWLSVQIQSWLAATRNDQCASNVAVSVTLKPCCRIPLERKRLLCCGRPDAGNAKVIGFEIVAWPRSTLAALGFVTSEYELKMYPVLPTARSCLIGPVVNRPFSDARSLNTRNCGAKPTAREDV